MLRRGDKDQILCSSYAIYSEGRPLDYSSYFRVILTYIKKLRLGSQRKGKGEKKDRAGSPLIPFPVLALVEAEKLLDLEELKDLLCRMNK